MIKSSTVVALEIMICDVCKDKVEVCDKCGKELLLYDEIACIKNNYQSLDDKWHYCDNCCYKEEGFYDPDN